MGKVGKNIGKALGFGDAPAPAPVVIQQPVASPETGQTDDRQQVSDSARRQRRRQRLAAAQGSGRESTLLSGGRESALSGSSAGKTLLGQ